MTRWGKEITKNLPKPPVIVETQKQRLTDLGTRLGQCMLKARSDQRSQP